MENYGREMGGDDRVKHFSEVYLVRKAQKRTLVSMHLHVSIERIGKMKNLHTSLTWKRKYISCPPFLYFLFYFYLIIYYQSIP